MDRFAARTLLAKCLHKDAERHRRGNFADLGTDFKIAEEKLGDPSEHHDPLVGLTLNFWHSWIDERNHGFPGFYNRIPKQAWPDLAHQLAGSLEGGQTGGIPSEIRYFRQRRKVSMLARLRRKINKKTQGSAKTASGKKAA